MSAGEWGHYRQESFEDYEEGGSKATPARADVKGLRPISHAK